MRNWERPMVVVDTFAANEFVSTCAEGGSAYKFQCNAGEEGHHYNVYYLDKNNHRHYIASDIPFTYPQFSGYHPCNAKHEASTKDEFINGYIDDQSTILKDEKIPVVIWTDKGKSVHCTTNLTIESWEKTHS